MLFVEPTAIAITIDAMRSCPCNPYAHLHMHNLTRPNPSQYERKENRRKEKQIHTPTSTHPGTFARSPHNTNPLILIISTSPIHPPLSSTTPGLFPFHAHCSLLPAAQKPSVDSQVLFFVFLKSGFLSWYFPYHLSFRIFFLRLLVRSWLSSLCLFLWIWGWIWKWYSEWEQEDVHDLSLSLSSNQNSNWNWSQEKCMK